MSLPKLDVLGTRVARRVLFMFMAGAAAPVAVMALLSFAAIRSQARAQSEARLSQLTSVQAQSILGRLGGAAAQARSAGALAYRAAAPDLRGTGTLPLPPVLSGLLLDVGGEHTSVGGDVGPLPRLSPDQASTLAGGGDVLFVDSEPGGGPSRILIGSQLDGGANGSGMVWARIVGDSVWGAAATQAADPSVVDMCVLDASDRPLYCASGSASRLPAQLGRGEGDRSNSGQSQLTVDGERHLVAWRDVYLRSGFAAPSWTVAVSETLESAYGASGQFVYNLLLSMLIGLAGALLFTHIVVRRAMEPLRDLTVGTQRLARQDLEARVEVRSEDEFGELATSFNRMAERLGMQFNQLEARRAIDHAALTTSDSSGAVRALLNGVTTVVPSGTRALALRDADQPDVTTLFVLHGDGDSRDGVHIEHAAVPLLPFERNGSPWVTHAEDVPPVFRPLVANGCRLPLLVLPLRVGDKPFGAIAIEPDPRREIAEEDLRRAQDLADQAAVALEKLRLDQEVASMSWETLRALANTIDAKSAWTKGHSERVTDLSLAMAGELGLSEGEMDAVHRGGLLHDIGKIAVPADVLDFDGVLTPEMRAVMEKHPEAGARILQPIRAYKPIIPIVLYHHERWDGSGYPERLEGEGIPALARLVAVADVFDAMVSARPYRPALDAEVVWQHIRERSGSDFDPAIVLALDRVMRDGWRPRTLEGARR